VTIHASERAEGDSDPQAGSSKVRYTLKEAADLTGRSVTTLRRYIRASKLRADKSPGRFGPEYTLDEPALVEAGFDVECGGRQAVAPSAAPVPFSPRGESSAIEKNGGPLPLERILQDYVPADLYRELAMKHEQLLVQYGMVRASGQRLFEFREEAERSAEDLARSEVRQKEMQDRASREIGFLKQHLRQAELEIEQRNMEIAGLREKVRVLELVTRNAVTTESIEKQFLQVFEKERQVEALLNEAAGASEAASSAALPVAPAEGDDPLTHWLDAPYEGGPEPEAVDH
jgi:hypothetical protein